MSAVVFLLIAAVISVVGTGVLYLRNRTRPPTSVGAGIDDFRREMQALAPQADDRRRQRKN